LPDPALIWWLPISLDRWTGIEMTEHYHDVARFRLQR